MHFHYVPAPDQPTRDGIFRRMAYEGLLGCAMSAFAAPTLEDWRRVTAHGVLLCCTDAATGAALGVGQFTPWFGRVWRFDFTAFRAGFACAAQQARGGFAYLFARHEVSAIIGITPARFRHAWGLALACGFRVLGRLPGACWLARKQRYEDGVLVCCTPHDLRTISPKEATMGFGGGGTVSSPSVPEVTAAPKQEVQKPITEAATAARQTQKEKAARAAGLYAAIRTSPLNRAETTRKTLLGQ